MNRVSCPGKVHTMHETMFPVVGYIRQHDADEYRDPVGGNIENRKFCSCEIDSNVKPGQKGYIDRHKERQSDVVGEGVTHQRPVKFFD